MCDVVCVPSRNEPFGIVVLEAWSALKPVVVTEIGGPKYYVEHEKNGLKIHPNVDSVYWGIDRMFSDFEKARWMGSNGRKGVEKYFSWDNISSHNLKVYQELCPHAYIHPELKQHKYKTEKSRISRHRILPVPNRLNIDGSSLKLEARLLLPDSNKSTVESLITHFTSHGVQAMKKDHCLKIKGDLENLANALVEARKELLPMQNQDVAS